MSRKFKNNIQAKALPITIIVLLLLSSISVIFILLPTEKTIVKAADTTDFDNYQVLTIDHDQVDSSLGNFPVLVYNSSWKSGINATSFSFFSDAGVELD